jgi:broad specificity phosphatase PhoE
MLDTLVVVRHGQAQNNLVYEAKLAGLSDDKIRAIADKTSPRSWRLTQLGIEQAIAAGKWIRENVGSGFDRHYTSDYARTMETAFYLRLASARWWLEPNLRELDWGLTDVFVPKEEQERVTSLAPGFFNHREADDFLMRPPHGESLSLQELRLNLVYEPFHHEDSDGKSAIIVCHEMTAWTIRFRIERLTQEQYMLFKQSSDPTHKINNGQVLVYTRTDPTNPTRPNKPYCFMWMRSICPWEPSRSLNGGDWQEISRPAFTNEELMVKFEAFPPIDANDLKVDPDT